MVKYVIRLKNREGQDGFYVAGATDESGQPRPLLTSDPGRGPAQRFDTEEAAEAVLSSLISNCGVDPTAAEVEPVAAHDGTIQLVVRKTEAGAPLDYISVERHQDKRLLIVGDCGEEASEELPDELADLLVQVLYRIRDRLKG